MLTCKKEAALDLERTARRKVGGRKRRGFVPEPVAQAEHRAGAAALGRDSLPGVRLHDLASVSTTSGHVAPHSAPGSSFAISHQGLNLS